MSLLPTPLLHLQNRASGCSYLTGDDMHDAPREPRGERFFQEAPWPCACVPTFPAPSGPT